MVNLDNFKNLRLEARRRSRRPSRVRYSANVPYQVSVEYIEYRTPAEASLIEVDGKNRWITLIQNASLHKANSV